MNFPSRFLSIFKNHNADMSAQDGQIIVPPMIQPVIEIPEALSVQFFGANSGTYPTSVINHINSTNLASVASNPADLFVITPGLWRLHFMGQVTFTYTDVSLFGASITMVGVTTGRITRLKSWHPFNSQQPFDFNLVIALEENTLLSTTLGATAVAQTSGLHVCCLANRLG